MQIKNMPTILVVDDEMSMREFLSIMLETEGYKVSTVNNGSDAIKSIQNNDYDLIIADIKIRKGSGIDILKESITLHPNTPVIMITSFASTEVAVEAMKLGAYDYITKPFNVDEVKIIIKNALIKNKKISRKNYTVGYDYKKGSLEKEDIFMKEKLRKEDFKLGCIHGTLVPEKSESEAAIQRKVYLSQRLKIVKSRDEKIIIRLFGYEVPLEKKTRGECVDLMAYDKDHNLYIIELKKSNSKENIDKVIKQLNGYANKVKEVKEDIEKDFENEFFYPIKFKEEIKKLIIAPKNFYKEKGKQLKDKDNSIEYGYIKNISDKKNCKPLEIHLIK